MVDSHITDSLFLHSLEINWSFKDKKTRVGLESTAQALPAFSVGLPERLEEWLQKSPKTSFQPIIHDH